VIDELNADPACTGYIVPLPLPRHLDANAVLERMDPAKGTDGLRPVSLGRLALGVDAPMPCTPRGIRNAVPFDPRPPMVTSGLRIGTPAPATRGFTDDDFEEVSDVIALTLQPEPDIAALRARSEALTAKHPLYPHLSEAEAEAEAQEAGEVR
jgi:hypothetical protein